ncbi:hypothetical protein [Arthrobacter sp. ISL-5]|uniref:hypothetical protein n=1 Tax=Arthrobacter sp. ISL-5 TaxID=2819111 RepID=UPI001BE622F5|nr:hypothetical protein [Arthrobacter sp. ISL-5]MBT2553533.1 hypothetical protein [Arthrobacter sp. ISL-5]
MLRRTGDIDCSGPHAYNHSIPRGPLIPAAAPAQASAPDHLPTTTAHQPHRRRTEGTYISTPGGRGNGNRVPGRYVTLAGGLHDETEGSYVSGS